jgi:hypothetical protein
MASGLKLGTYKVIFLVSKSGFKCNLYRYMLARSGVFEFVSVRLIEASGMDMVGGCN